MTTRLLLGLLVLAACRHDPVTLQGETDAKQVTVAAKVSGRVDSLFVQEGDSVRRGEVVATLDGPEIRAKAAQAVAARDAARALRDKARNGAREEDIRAARNNWLRAVASATIAETTYARLDRLQREGVVPTQKRDEAEASLRASREGADAAKAQYDLAMAGARREDQAAAVADLRRAEGAVVEAESYVSENVLRSAVNGQVLLKIVEQGELVAPGQPVVTIIDLSDQWITLNLREDRLAGLRIGDTLRADHPGGGCGGASVRGLLYLAAGRLRHLAGDARSGGLRRAHLRGPRATGSAAPGAPPRDERAGAVAHRRTSMSGLAAVAGRELRRLRGLPVLWSLLGPIPVAMTLLLVGVFSAEVVRDLPVAVLDLDRSRQPRAPPRAGSRRPAALGWRATSRIWAPRGPPCSSGGCMVCWSSRVTSSATSSGVARPTSRSSTTRSISPPAATCRPTCPAGRPQRPRCSRR